MFYNFTKISRLLLFFSAILICYADASAQQGKSKLQKSAYPIDTIYFPFQNGIQMIAILNFTNWERFIAHKEATSPRGLRWSAVIPPHSPNLYIFRDNTGKILKSYHIKNPESFKLRSTAYTTPSPFAFFKARVEIAPNKYLVYENMETKPNNDFRFGSKKGLINNQGTLIIPCEYDDIQRLGPNIVLAKDGKYGLVNQQLKPLTPMHFDEMPAPAFYNSNQLEVRINKKWGIADQDGQILLPCKYESISNYSLYSVTAYMVSENGLLGLLNTDLSIRIPALYESIQILLDCNQKVVFKVIQQGKNGLLDKLGNPLLPCDYDYIGNNCPYPTGKAGKFGLLDASYKSLIPMEFDTIIKYKNFRASKDGKWAFFTEAGVPLTEGAVVDKMEWFYGYYMIRANGLFGLINELQPNEVTYIAPQYEALTPVFPDFRKKERYFLVKKNSLWGVIEAIANKQIIPLEYDEIKTVPYYKESKKLPDGENIYVRKKDEAWKKVELK